MKVRKTLELKEKILKLYFIDKKKQINIAKKLKVSKYIVSRTLAKDSRYKEEKEKRKLENKKKNREFTKQYMNKKRGENDYLILKKMHDQASFELSGGKRPMNNIAFRNWNSSLYKYNDKNKCYVLKKGLTVGADVPKKINWK